LYKVLPLALLNVKGSVGSALSAAAASSTSLRLLIRAQSAVGGLWRSKVALVMGACVCALLLVKVFYFVADALAVVILLGAAARTERTVAQRLTPLYDETLAFWVLALLVELAGSIPVIGYFVLFLRPLLLGALLVGATPVLRLLLLVLPAAATRVGKRAIIAAASGEVVAPRPGLPSPTQPSARSPGVRKVTRQAARLASPAVSSQPAAEEKSSNAPDSEDMSKDKRD
jgi:hypothetical protein